MSSFDTYYGAGNLDEGRVVEWLNNAALSTTTSEKSQLLRKVQEVVINKSPHLLNQFLSEILAFTTDRDAEIKKWLVGFIEEACKKNEQSIDKVMPNLHMLLCDESIQVQKRVIQAATSIYRNMLSWLAKALQITDSMEQAWTRFSNIKIEILNMVDSDNDGIRTHSVKFLEGVVLLQTYPEPGLPRKENDFSLEDIPLTLKFARRRKLEEEAHHIFSLLVKFHGSPHISSVNLMACMGALCTIAKSRPIFMPHVVTALEDLNNNLPPTLTPSQVNSVRKHLKLQLINILKHPSSIEVQSTVISLASELGYSSQEISKLLPRIDEYQRRNRNFKRNSETIFPSLNKRPRFDPTDMEVDDEELNRQKQEACKLNEQFILEKLKIDTATHLVMEAMKKLPDVIPNHFITNYTPAANAGTPAHLKQVAKILAVQFTDAGVGPGMNCLSKDPPMRMKIPAEVEDAIIKGPTKKESELIEEKLETISQIKTKDEEKIIRSTKPRIKTLRLDQITRPLNAGTRELMLIKSVERILQSEQAANTAGASLTRNKIITTLASTFGPAIREAVLKFILKDIRLHIDLALAWLYEEYSFMQGFNRMSAILRREAKPDQSYNTLLCALIANMEAETRERDHLLMRLFLESPYITEEAVEMLKRICIQENRAAICMGLLQELVCRRPPKYMTFLNVLLHYTAHEIAAIRDEAITRVLQLYERQELQSIIEEQSLVYLCFLTQPQPPPILFGDDRGRPQVLDNWNDESSKACLYLYLALLPSKESLVHELSRVYIQTTADVKRTILRLLEQPIRGMGMESTELLALVEHCPKGAETLITRVIHILTERGSPSAILVNKVRELYQTRVSDVRFLIPVLNGLTKKEVIAALPKLIKLNPVVVKEVFNRLLGAHSEGPITPAELLIALHMIDQSKADLKTVMKATSLCFAEKAVYTQEVLAVVMQQLMDVTPLPTLLMRTVIQSLSLYPRLSGFVMNILQRLILKQVWKHKVVWEGFIKCCQRTKPQSFQVLLQLPPTQLSEALTTCPDLRTPLLDHVQSFTEVQRAHLPTSVMDVLLGRISENTENGTHLNTEPSEVITNEPLPPGME